ncbi:hypothetical protein QYR00_17125 [Agrobacterium tumefaciens]|uniref:hypothetical protein n=1 Tax=Rhizobium/Agrobacterium group TaxID=227290 RepID=UPI00209A8ECD|nr:MULTISPECIES: hypothetical protein [Rhizobium/Agrobacterium group]WKL22243.1 hypothetical protein QYR00_17125 [Agrobacterium tumefaciens]
MSARHPFWGSAPAACAIVPFAQIFVDDDEDLLTKGATMSHTPTSQEESCKHALSKDDRQNNVLMFPLEAVNAALRNRAERVQRAIAPVKPAAMKPVPGVGSIRTRYLYDVVKDTRSRLYSGTVVIASVAGVTVSQAADAIRQVRYGAGWLDFSYTPPIRHTRGDEIEQALRLLGYVGHWRWLHHKPTLAAYLKSRTGVERDHPSVVFLSTHAVAVNGGVFCDVLSGGVVIDIDDAKGRRKKVNRVFVVTDRIAPSKIASRTPAPKKGASSKLDRLFHEAIKAETNAARVKITPHEVFVIRPRETGWYWLGSRENIEDQILMPRSDNRLAGNSDAAAAYREAKGY